MRLSHWILVVSLLSFPLDSFADIEGRYDLDTKEFLKRITLQLKAEKSAKKADLKKKLNLYTKMFNKVKQWFVLGTDGSYKYHMQMGWKKVTSRGYWLWNGKVLKLVTLAKGTEGKHTLRCKLKTTKLLLCTWPRAANKSGTSQLSTQVSMPFIAKQPKKTKSLKGLRTYKAYAGHYVLQDKQFNKQNGQFLLGLKAAKGENFQTYLTKFLSGHMIYHFILKADRSFNYVVDTQTKRIPFSGMVPRYWKIPRYWNIHKKTLRLVFLSPGGKIKRTFLCKLKKPLVCTLKNKPLVFTYHKVNVRGFVGRYNFDPNRSTELLRSYLKNRGKKLTIKMIYEMRNFKLWMHFKWNGTYLAFTKKGKKTLRSGNGIWSKNGNKLVLVRAKGKKRFCKIVPGGYLDCTLAKDVLLSLRKQK